MTIVGTYLPWLLLAGVIVAGGLFITAIMWHNLRVRRVRRAYRGLPDEMKDRVLALIQEAASGRPSVTLLRLDGGCQCHGHDALLRSHVGGVPYLEAGEDWPTGQPAKFLLQVRLDEPALGQRWQGRLLTVFLMIDRELGVRSYAAPSFNRSVAVPGPVPPVPCILLIPVRVPVGGDEFQVPASPAGLCEFVPAIPQLLGEFTDDSAGLLSQILRPEVYGYDLE